METKEGDIFKSILEGEKYTVKKVANSMVILEARNGKKQILTGVSTLNNKSFYEKKEETEG